MSTFETRLSVGESHERRVRREFELRAYTASHSGQGILPEQIREAMRASGCQFRHFPDLLVARCGETYAIDAKDRLHSTETGRYAVSRECVEFGLHVDALGLPVFYVFGNLGVLCPTEIRSYGRLTSRAAGGAYYLVPERLAHHFDDVFGSPETGSAAA